jgi:CHAT domain-containing protein
MRHLREIGLCELTLALSLAGSLQASALTLEQAREDCRMSVGRSAVQSCVRGGQGDREGCRAKVKPLVRACVEKALNAVHGRANVPLAVPKEQGPSDDVAKRAEALPTSFVAPPRTITDIAAILDSEKPDPAKTSKVKREADAEPPAAASRVALARFYYDRGHARAELGRLSESIADAEKAVELAHGAGDSNMLGRFEQFLGLQYSAAGDPKKALAIFLRQLRDTNAPGAKGFAFNGGRQVASIYLQMGDLGQAEAYLRRSEGLLHEARTSGMPGWRKSYPIKGQSWEADVEFHRALILEARGQFREAEQAYRLAELRRRGSIAGILSSPNPPPRSQLLEAADLMVVAQARMKARQGRLAEAEADARRALLARLKDQGKYSPTTPKYIMGLASALIEQGRYAESEKLVRVAIDINRAIGVADDSQVAVRFLSQLGNILTLEHKRTAAAAIYAEIDKATTKWDPKRREAFDLNGSRITSLYASGQVERGIAMAEALLKRNISRVGEQHYDTAAARGILAIGYMKAHRDAKAVREFRAAIPRLLDQARENADDDNTTLVAARSERLQNIVEAYIALVDRGQDGRGEQAALETFALADAIRGHSVQQALAASSARMVTKDKALADVVREEQDLSKQVNAQLGTLNNVLALPSSQRDDDGVKALQASIAKLRLERDNKRAEIAKRFPSYASLIDPKPPSVDDIKSVLGSEEALLSFYFGRDVSFVWAVPKAGPVAFAAVHATSGEIESKIRKLREALEPQAAMISDIPPFDLKLAYELYSLLLKPVEAGWKPATNLIVVTNGALGLLPLSLLPTAPVVASDDGGPLFSGYRKVPWLARTHAVTMVPSAAALRTLRQIPPGADKRERMIGFGNPIFSKEQAEQQAEQNAPTSTQVAMAATTRGVPLRRRSSPKLDGVDSAELAMLPPLPDTADELKAIATALEADPSKVLELGAKANEQTVKTMDLSKYKIIVFATHGLVPGELNGLTQPALALSAPAVAGVPGDGLLTMEEILTLKLDADWVVLSACNTGTGAGAGAEAASGLGRAFFYAGTRALLVTNWSVHSQSARDLTTDLFRRQTANPKLTRGEALRQAEMALLDGKGYVDENGKTLFAYGHPLFWAPYTIIGDGGV